MALLAVMQAAAGAGALGLVVCFILSRDDLRRFVETSADLIKEVGYVLEA